MGRLVPTADDLRPVAVGGALRCSGAAVELRRHLVHYSAATEVLTGGSIEEVVVRVVVFGATGKTGSHVCRVAVEQGHQVTAFGRSVERLDHAGLDIHKGDVFDADSVAEAVVAHEGAIVCLGSTGLRDTSTLSTGTKAVVDAMVEHDAERLVVMSAAGVGESWQQIPLSSKVLFRTMLRRVFADHEAQEAVVRQSPLDWTIVRPAVLKDDPGTGSYVATNSGSITKITRADVAACLVDQLDKPDFSRQSISVTN
ncbi:MAG: SDR family oxidoreductase [Actinomycetota bacterium]